MFWAAAALIALLATSCRSSPAGGADASTSESRDACAECDAEVVSVVRAIAACPWDERGDAGGIRIRFAHQLVDGATCPPYRAWRSTHPSRAPASAKPTLKVLVLDTEPKARLIAAQLLTTYQWSWDDPESGVRIDDAAFARKVFDRAKVERDAEMAYALGGLLGQTKLDELGLAADVARLIASPDRRAVREGVISAVRSGPLTRDPALEAVLVGIARSEGDSFERQLALGALADERACPLSVELLGDADPFVRLEAARRAVWCPEGAEPLIARAERALVDHAPIEPAVVGHLEDLMTQGTTSALQRRRIVAIGRVVAATRSYDEYTRAAANRILRDATISSPR